MAKFDIDHTLTDEIVCPYCGYEFENSYEYIGDLVECEECGKNFSFYTDTTIRYTTHKQPCANGDGPHNWICLSFENNGDVLFPNLYRCQNCNITSIFKGETRHHFESFFG